MVYGSKKDNNILWWRKLPFAGGMISLTDTAFFLYNHRLMENASRGYAPMARPQNIPERGAKG